MLGRPKGRWRLGLIIVRFVGVGVPIAVVAVIVIIIIIIITKSAGLYVDPRGAVVDIRARIIFLSLAVGVDVHAIIHILVILDIPINIRRGIFIALVVRLIIRVIFCLDIPTVIFLIMIDALTTIFKIVTALEISVVGFMALDIRHHVAVYGVACHSVLIVIVVLVALILATCTL